MIVLKIFFQILWGKSRDASSLSQFHNALRYSKVSKDMKNFYSYNNFFKTVININMVAFCITFARYKKISIYKKWLVNSDWPEEIFRLKNLNLKPFEVRKLWSQVTQKVNKIIAIILTAKQKGWNAANRDIEAIQSKTRARRDPKKPWGM